MVNLPIAGQYQNQMVNLNQNSNRVKKSAPANPVFPIQTVPPQGPSMNLNPQAKMAGGQKFASSKPGKEMPSNYPSQYLQQ
jgi:hypothetical protein